MPRGNPLAKGAPRGYREPEYLAMLNHLMANPYARFFIMQERIAAVFHKSRDGGTRGGGDNP